MDSSSFPPVIAILLADVSGFLEGMQAAVASAEEAAAAIDESMTASFEGVGAAADAAAAQVETAMGSAAASAEAGAAATGEAAAASDGFFASAGGAVDQYASKVALAGVAVAAASVWMASSYQDAMLHIQTQAGASREEVLNMGAAIMGLAGQVGESPKKLAEALYPIESAGIRGAAALDILKLAAEGAQVSGADLESTASALTTVMASGIPGVKSAADAMGQMNAIVGDGKMKFEDLDKAMSSGIVSAAQTFGVSLSSVGAALDTLTINGIPAEQAASRLRMGIALLAAPSKQAAKILTDLGLSTTEAQSQANSMAKTLAGAGVSTTKLADDMKQPDGIFVALTDLKKHMTDAGLSADEQSAVISRAFGGGRMGTAIMSAMSNLDQVKEHYDRINQSASQFPADWAARQQQFGYMWDSLKAKVDVFLVNLGTKLIPIIEQVIAWFEKHKTVAEYLALVIGFILVGALAAFGVALFVANWEIILIITAIALLVAGVIYAYTHWSWFRDAVQDVGKAIGWLKDEFVKIYNWIKGVDWKGLWHGVVEWVEKIPGEVGGFLSKTWNTITHWVSTGYNWLTSNFSKWGEAAIHWIVKSAEDLPANLAHFVGFILGWITGEALQLPGYFDSWLFAFVNWVAQAAVQIIPDLFDFSMKISGFLQNLPAKIMEWAKSNVPGILKWLVDAAVAVDDKLGEFGHKLEGWLLSLPGLLNGWAVDASNWLVDMGADILKGVWKGITRELGNIGNIIGQVKDGFVNGFKSAFGINSPSLVIANEVGHPIGEGFIKGMNDSMPKDLSHWVPGMPKVPSIIGSGGSGLVGAGVAAAAASSGSGQGDVNVNVYAETNADPHQIAAEVGFTMRTVL